MIKIAIHPLNLDPSAEMVSGSREEISIFRVKGEFVACRGGLALTETFKTQDAARAALNSVRESSSASDPSLHATSLNNSSVSS